MRVIATGSYCREVSGDPPPLKGLAEEATGAPVRRTGRFVQLALIGAGRCVDGRNLPPDTATYFSSCRGDLETTLAVLRPLCEQNRPPAPFDFINTVGTSACFHIARAFGLRGRSQFVTSRYAPLHAALRLAALDMESGAVKTALIGSADMCTAPISEHRDRIGMSADTRVGEGSHWLLVSYDDRLKDHLGCVRDVLSFADDDALLEHLEHVRVAPSGAVIAAGPHLRPELLDRCREITGIEETLDYRAGLPWHDSQTGLGIHRFFADRTARWLWHIDGDATGRATLLVLEAASGDH